MQCTSWNKIIQVCKNAVETDLSYFVKSNKIYTTRWRTIINFNLYTIILTLVSLPVTIYVQINAKVEIFELAKPESIFVLVYKLFKNYFGYYILSCSCV